MTTLSSPSWANHHKNIPMYRPTLQRWKSELEHIPMLTEVEDFAIFPFSRWTGRSTLTISEYLKYPITSGGECIYTPQGTGRGVAMMHFKHHRVIGFQIFSSTEYTLKHARMLYERGFVIMFPTIRLQHRGCTVLLIKQSWKDHGHLLHC